MAKLNRREGEIGSRTRQKTRLTQRALGGDIAELLGISLEKHFVGAVILPMHEISA